MDLLQAVLREKYLLARCSPFLCCAGLLVLPRLPFPIVPAVVVFLCLLCCDLHVELVSMLIEAFIGGLNIHTHMMQTIALIVASCAGDLLNLHGKALMPHVCVSTLEISTKLCA